MPATPPSRAPHAAVPGGAEPSAPLLAPLAETLHQAAADHPEDLVVFGSLHGQEVELALWPVAAETNHPTDVLIGWQPPDHAAMLGLVTSGRATSSQGTEQARVTVVMDRQGRAATVLHRRGEPETITEPPQGWGADALRRCLGLPTPPPESALSACVETNWLAVIADQLGSGGSCAGSPSWGQVALLHPLHPEGGPASPAELAALCNQLDADSSWGRMLRLFARTSTSSDTFPHPPGGRTVALDRWFDPGSFSRWSLRRQPDPDDLLLEVVSELPEPVAADLLDALVSLT